MSPVGVYKRAEKQKEILRYWAKQPRLWQRTIKEKECPVCKKIFKPKNSLAKHCSTNCAYKNRPKKGVWRKCKTCGERFYVLPTYKKTAKYCSRKCQHKGLTMKDSKTNLKCKQCGKVYYEYQSYLRIRKRRFCSMKCRELSQRTKYKKKKKTSTKTVKKIAWMVFSQYIRQRDGGICISCGKVDYWRKMDAGHYIPKTAGLALYFDERNVNCQCTYCNRWMHGNLSKYALALIRKYGNNILYELDEKRNKIKKITAEEYKEFIEKYKTLCYEKEFECFTKYRKA